MILEYLKEQAKIYNANKEIKRAVITVPAHFNNLQREATIEAANKAGLEVYKIINEPTAAAIAYGDIIKSDNERKVLIFDIGGGTFDVSIVKITGNEYTVLASEGEEHLGGEDFNQRLLDYVIKEIKKDKDCEAYDFYRNKKDDIGLQTIKRIR
jgi:molecular chaperone DnaK